jgi:hypothetical protein
MGPPKEEEEEVRGGRRHNQYADRLRPRYRHMGGVTSWPSDEPLADRATLVYHNSKCDLLITTEQRDCCTRWVKEH